MRALAQLPVLGLNFVDAIGLKQQQIAATKSGEFDLSFKAMRFYV